ncbi:DUF3120 domain-containing protein [Synechococcus sp. PCC 7502]|uniref:DUF3120 domain-containing protein n=1 Tax=Synechococcus sp. PCC 7502 TaxID=1173263 RepID=UPI00030D79CF|nr:DUF3120 domain-containing protein [Synechococcus sp. PCC 7502]
MKFYDNWDTSSIQINGIGLNWWTWSDHFTLWLASAFLVSIPVFFQAPLVRQAPWLSLILTVGWLAIAEILLVSGNVSGDRKSQQFGSLIWGFSLSWVCGTAYWGWLRFEPLWHLPIEAIALPWAVWALTKSTHQIGGWFYLASLLGTAVTDLYFYLNNLIPHWRAIMELDGNLAAIQPIFQDAVAQLQTIGGIGSGVVLAIAITVIAIKAMASSELHSWSFAGALLSTIFVDALFAIVACFC